MSHIIGIDLGTRYSCISVWRNKRCEIITDGFASTIPSVVAFYNTARLVGNSALNLKDALPGNTVYDIKRIIGKRMDDPQIPLVQELVTYKIIDDQTPHHNAMVEIESGNQYRPEEICFYILAEIKRIASKYLKSPVEKAVITVPAYFNDSQRQATLDAATMAGLEVVKMINEPTAAALAYGLGSTSNRNVIIYDFGAGTLDVSLMNINNGVFRTLSVSGNNHLGGEDIDYLLMSKVLRSFKAKNKLSDITISKLSHIKLKNAVEMAKKVLSNNTKALIWVEQFYNGLDIKESISRKTLESVCNELFILAMKPLEDVIANSRLTKHNIDDIVLVGGSTRIPKIRKLIAKYFEGTQATINHTLNPDETVSTGAAIYGHIMSDNSDPFTDHVVLLDIVSLSLGVETLRKQMTTVIPRGTIIPTSKTKVFTTDADDQDQVTINIYEGERKLTKDNYLIGSFDLFGFEKAPRGHANIKITFSVDLNGILQVTALEKKSGATNTVTISSMWSSKGRMSQEEIEKTIEEAKKYEVIDTAYTLKIGLVFKIRTLCESIQSNLADPKIDLTPTDVKRIKRYVTKTLKWLNNPLEKLDISKLKSEKSRITKNYCLLIHKETLDNVKGMSDISEVSNLNEDEEENQTLQKVEVKFDLPEYERDAMKDLKKVIVDMCRNITQIINNPVTHIETKDKEYLRDYLESVTIWTYITSANSSADFVAKIDEINGTVESIMSKYDENVFSEAKEFKVKDELKATCNALKGAIESNYLSLPKCDLDKLQSMILDALLWLETHDDDTECKYRLDAINSVCNQYYENLSTLEHLEPENVEESDEEDIPEFHQPIKINEDIDSLIDNMSVYLEVDTDKLVNSTKVNYRD